MGWYMARDVGRKGIGEIIYLYLNFNFLRHKIVEWPRGSVRRCSILLDIKEMQAWCPAEMTTYLPELLIWNAHRSRCWWRPDTTELQQEGQLLEPFAQACPVLLLFFFFNKVIQHFHSQQYDQQNSAGICPSMDLEENIHTSLVPKISKLRSKKELSDCHRGKKKTSKQVVKYSH